MHMSDALLSPAVGGTLAATAGGVVAWSARRFQQDPAAGRRVPLAGVLGAFVFAGQMLNFTIPGTGSSGHIGGGVLLAVLLGPHAGFLTLAAILVIQCLFFMDGGLLALGANILNLGFWPCFLGLPLYRLLAGASPARARRALASVAAVTLSLELGALGVAVQTVLSGRTDLPLAAFAPLMLLIHLPIALAEGLVTAGVLEFVAHHRPEALAHAGPAHAAAGWWRPLRPVLVTLALAALTMATVLAWFASPHPDGLEWSVARVTGQEESPHEPGRLVAALQHVQERVALFPDYAPRSPPEVAAEAPGAVESDWPAVSGGGALAGLAGALLTGGVTVLTAALILLLRRRRPQRAVA